MARGFSNARTKNRRMGSARQRHKLQFSKRYAFGSSTHFEQESPKKRVAILAIGERCPTCRDRGWINPGRQGKIQERCPEVKFGLVARYFGFVAWNSEITELPSRQSTRKRSGAVRGRVHVRLTPPNVGLHPSIKFH